MTKVHLIGNAHLDPVWLWRWQEGYAEVLATFRSALDRMEESDDFVFTCAGAAYYAWVEETDPAMFAEIQRRVAEGRWVLTGGWWIQPDCNAPCGESFARHGLYGQRYFQEKFGRRARVGYNVDSFGHSAMLPQILRQSGLDAYVMMRPNDTNEKQYPFDDYAFTWQAPDGSSVPTFRIPSGYNSNAFGDVADKARGDLVKAEKNGKPIMCFYGVGNHGGGPTIKNLADLHALMDASTPGDYALSSPDAYFDELSASPLPLLQDELQHHASGCYTAVMEVKRLNRLAETRLLAAEKYVEMARAHGIPLAQEPLENAWRLVLFNQFHDTLGGCSIFDAYEDARESYGESLSTAARVTNRALQAIAWNIDTQHGVPLHNSKHDFHLWEQEGRGVPVVVFNPHAFEATLPVRTGVRIESICDDAGVPVLTQRIRSQVTNHEHDKWENTFLATVPPMGWRTYWLYQAKRPEAPSTTHTLTAGAYHLENDWLRVELEPTTGQLIRVLDKSAGRELLSAPASAIVIDETPCDTWAHKIFSFRDEVGRFAGTRVEVMESGDVQATLRVTSSWNRSVIVQKLTLYREKPGLYIDYRVQWNEEHKMLKLAFPTPCKQGESISSIPYGFLRRPANGKDQPMQGWVTLQEAGYGLGIVTDSRTAYDAMDGELRITALRSPIYADHFGTRDQFCEFTEQGEQRFMLVLLPAHADTTPLSHLADEITTPVERIVGTYHAGKVPREASLLQVDLPNVHVTALKPAEDGHGLILRCHETAGVSCEARFALPSYGISFAASFTPQQIRSFRLADGEATPVNMLEDPIA